MFPKKLILAAKRAVLTAFDEVISFCKKKLLEANVTSIRKYVTRNITDWVTVVATILIQLFIQ